MVVDARVTRLTVGISRLNLSVTADKRQFLIRVSGVGETRVSSASGLDGRYHNGGAVNDEESEDET